MPAVNGLHPDLGVYLQPDADHQASALEPGPQAYAYAGGRPLVNIDPSGRLWFGLVPAEATALLSRNHALGAAAKELKSNRNVEISFVESSYPDFKGGKCTPSSGGAGECAIKITLEYNFAIAAQQFQQWSGGLATISPSQLIAHELGHAYHQFATANGGGSNPLAGPDQKATSLNFENVLRAPGPYRNFHDGFGAIGAPVSGMGGL